MLKSWEEGEEFAKWFETGIDVILDGKQFNAVIFKTISFLQNA